MTIRTQTPDLLKGIAVLLMIQVHIIELFATPQISGSVIGKFLLFLGGPLVAPIFVFFLGYFLIESTKTTKQLSLRGVQLFILGMCLNVLLNLNLIISANRGVLNINIWPYIFGVDILQFAGFATILFAVAKNIIEKSIFVSLFGILLCAFLGHYLLSFIPTTVSLKYVSAFFYGSTSWSYFPLFPWLAYALAGIAFYQIKEKISINKFQNGASRMLILIVFLFFMASTIFYAVRVSSNLQLYYHHGIVFALWTLLFLAFYSYFVNETNNIIGQSVFIRYIKWMGQHVTVIYVIQWILIGNIATSIYKTMSSPFYFGLSFIGIVSISSALCFVYLKIKKPATETSVS